MLDLDAVMTGLKTNLSAITGLVVYDYVPDAVNPPAAVVNFPDILEYDHSMKGGNNAGLSNMVIPVSLVMARVNNQGEQKLGKQYLSATGAKSVKAAIEADKTLGGACKTLRVERIDQIRTGIVGTQPVLQFDFNVRIYA